MCIRDRRGYSLPQTAAVAHREGLCSVVQVIPTRAQDFETVWPLHCPPGCHSDFQSPQSRLWYPLYPLPCRNERCLLSHLAHTPRKYDLLLIPAAARQLRMMVIELQLEGLKPWQLSKLIKKGLNYVLTWNHLSFFGVCIAWGLGNAIIKELCWHATTKHRHVMSCCQHTWSKRLAFKIKAAASVYGTDSRCNFNAIALSKT